MIARLEGHYPDVFEVCAVNCACSRWACTITLTPLFVGLFRGACSKYRNPSSFGKHPLNRVTLGFVCPRDPVLPRFAIPVRFTICNRLPCRVAVPQGSFREGSRAVFACTMRGLLPVAVCQVPMETAT